MTPEELFSVVARFWSKVEMSGDCWLWTGQTNNHGYGRFEFWADNTRRRVLAHRMARALVGRPISSGVKGRHTCDTPACVRPDHILEGTQGDNIRDAIARGRLRTEGLSSLTPVVCRNCGVVFEGSPNRRYCDAHRDRRSRSLVKGEVA